jgi:hypothetical protein
MVKSRSCSLDSFYSFTEWRDRSAKRSTPETKVASSAPIRVREITNQHRDPELDVDTFDNKTRRQKVALIALEAITSTLL